MISRRGLAIQVGVSEAMLRRHEGWGTIWPEEDGTWDVVKTRERLKAAQNPAREAMEAVGQPRVSRGVKAPDDGDPHEEAPTKAAKPPKAGAMRPMTFNEARAANENLKAARLKIELAELEGRLIDRDEAVKAVRTFAQQDRDAILAWPARSAPVIAAEFGVDPHALHAALDESLRAHLTDQVEILLGQ